MRTLSRPFAARSSVLRYLRPGGDKGGNVTRGAEVVISIDGRDDGALSAIVRVPDRDGRLQVKNATLEVSIWQEHDGVMRLRVRDVERGAVCYLQGNEALLALGTALGLTRT